MQKKHFGISPEVWAKCDPKLRKEIERHQTDRKVSLPVMIRMKPDAEAAATKNVEERQKRFDREVDDLIAQLSRENAQDIRKYWINWTVAATASIDTICNAAERNDVAEVLLLEPHKAII